MGRLKRILKTQDFKACAVIFVLLAAVYSTPYILGRSQNPLLQRSGLTGVVKEGIVSGQNTIDPNDGFTSQALGNTAADEWLRGDIPYWNYHEGVGMPLAGEMQSAALFPLTLLLRFNNGLVFFHFCLQLIAGIATYLFLKRLKLKFSLSLLGAIAFAFSGAFAWLTNAAFNPIAFLPLLLLGIELARNAAEKKQRRGWILIATALALFLYAGFPETAFINALFAYGWALVRLFDLDKKLRKDFFIKLIKGSAVGLLLAAPVLVAFLGFLPYSVTGGHAGGGYANIGLPINTLPALFMPYIFGPIFGFVKAGQPQDLFLFWSNVGGYLTLPIILFGLIAIFGKRPRSHKIYFSIFIAVVILKIFSFKPVAVLINAIPGMDQIAFYRYSIPALSFAAIVLAMFGIEAILKKEVSKKKTVVITGLLSLFTISLALFSRRLLNQLGAFPSHKWWALLSVLIGLSIVLVPVILLLKERLRFIAMAALITADTILMFTIPFLSLPKTTAVDKGPITYLQQNIGLNRFYTLHPIAPNYGSYYEISSININDLPIPKAWDEYIPKKLDSNAIPLIFTGYSRQDPSGASALDEFSRNVREYEKVGVKYLVADHAQVTPEFSAQNNLKLVYSDNLVDIYELPSPKPYFESSSDCALNNQRLDRVTAVCSTSSKLLRRELFMPGWSVTINGEKKNLSKENDVFQSVEIPAGESTVKYNYSPPHIVFGYIAFILGIAVIAGSYINIGRRGKNGIKPKD